jgi:hypothetical protein
VCIRKYKDDKAWIESERADFECAWATNLITYDKPMAFPTTFKRLMRWPNG